MVVQGLLLTAIGMSMVFLFLLLLIGITENLDRIVSALAKLLPVAGEEKAAPAARNELREIAAAVFLATRLSKQAH